MDDFSEERDCLLNLPNELFFGHRIPANISWAFPERESTEVVVDGLIHIFDRYPFTIDEDTPLEITTDGDVLMLRPVRGDKKDRVRASAAKMVKAHAKTLAKLAK